MNSAISASASFSAVAAAAASASSSAARSAARRSSADSAPAAPPPPASLTVHPVRHLFQEFAAVLAEPWPRVVVLTVFVEGAAVFGALAFFATHLHHTLGVSLTAAGAMVMAFGGGGTAFSFAARKLVPQLGDVGLARGGGWGLFPALGFVGFAPSAAEGVAGGPAR